MSVAHLKCLIKQENKIISIKKTEQTFMDVCREVAREFGIEEKLELKEGYGPLCGFTAFFKHGKIGVRMKKVEDGPDTVVYEASMYVMDENGETEF